MKLVPTQRIKYNMYVSHANDTIIMLHVKQQIIVYIQQKKYLQERKSKCADSKGRMATTSSTVHTIPSK